MGATAERRRVRRPARADGRAPAAPARDRRRAGAGRRWPRSRASSSCPSATRRRAYADSALPIGHGQTISQPWIVAAICQALALEGAERVLEVGTGSGYSAAVLARLAARGDQHRALRGARRPAPASCSRSSGVANVEVVVGDGSAGLPGPRAVRRDRRPRHGPGAAADACSSSSRPGAAWWSRSPADAADMLTVFRRLDGRVDPRPATGSSAR